MPSSIRIIPYDDLEKAVASINAGDRTLGLYVFADDPDVAEAVRGEGDMIDAFYAPYAKASAIVGAVLAQAQADRR